jgi:hypothetical protein
VQPKRQGIGTCFTAKEQKPWTIVWNHVLIAKQYAIMTIHALDDMVTEILEEIYDMIPESF